MLAALSSHGIQGAVMLPATCGAATCGERMPGCYHDLINIPGT